jgi:hypothetical protein
MIYVKSILAGLLAVLSGTILLAIVVVVGISILSRSSQDGSVGWDPIALARPLTWLVAILGIFLIGFLWEFYRVRSK